MHQDYEVWLEKLALHAPTAQYQHNRTGEDNADAHLKRQIMASEVVVAITKGQLDLGPWEQIVYGEFDGRRGNLDAGRLATPLSRFTPETVQAADGGL